MQPQAPFFALSQPQIQIWLAAEHCPDKALFTESVLLTFDQITPEQINYALNCLVQQTEVLRLRIVQTDDGPMQYDAGYTPFACRSVPFIDQSAAQDYFDAQSRQPIPLYAHALFDAQILTFPAHTALLLRVHHIISDTCGLVALLNHLFSFLAGINPPPFNSFLSLLTTPDDCTNHAAFWHETLKDAVLGATPHPLSSPLSHKVAWHRVCIGHTRSQQLRELAKRLGVSVYCVFFAAYALYLSRALGTDDVTIVVPRQNRPTDAHRNASGMFTLAVPVRVHLTPQTDFAALCQQVKSQSALAAQHKAYGFSRILSDCTKQNRHTALSHFTLSFLPYHLQTHGIKVQWDAHLGGAMTNLMTVQIADWMNSGAYTLLIDYRAEYYARSEIIAFADSLLYLIDQSITQSNCPLNCFSVLSSAQKEYLFQQQTGPDLPFDQTDTIVSRLRRQVAKTPNTRALSGKGTCYTFSELDAASDRVAQNLLMRGIAPQSLIAFLLPRTTTLPVILFGILKVGAAFVPIDFSYPEERIRYILADSNAAALITTSDISNLCGCPVISPNALLSQSPTPAPPFPNIQPDWLCYLIYTSGTTGKPKGVMLEHRGIVNFTQPDNNEFNRDICYNGKGIVAVGSICFDISMFELFITLLNGIPVVFSDENGMNNPAALASYLTESGANILHCTPSRLLAYLEEPSFHQAMQGVDIVLAAGEAFTQPLLHALRQATSARLYNGYGPTEVTIGATIGLIDEQITIGATIAGAHIYLLDKRQRMVPPGTLGEIAVGGLGLARGYWQRPELTAQRFITLTDSPIPERVYLTGDLGYALPDGRLIYSGRNDEQVKLRGLRIELSEVERCIESYEGVRQCAALVKEIDGRQHLCCYYAAPTPYDSAALKQHAGAFLARYMVPDVFHYLPDLPHTTNGKIDKKQLSTIDLAITRTYIAPHTACEQILCQIFSQVLHLDEQQIGVTDSFFELGGTSLQAARIVLLAKRAGITLEYGMIFEHPTARELAQCVQTDQNLIPARPISLLPSSEQHALCTSEEQTILREVLRKNYDYQKGTHALGTILLTGATGFLGIHILHELLTTTESTIYCVVRPKNRITCEKRLKGALFYYFENSFDTAFGKRLFAINGDILHDPIADLPTGVSIDTVIHCAANVSHFGVDDRIRQTNVDGVHNLISFCMTHNAALIHISTLSVGGFIDQEQADMGVCLSEQRLWLRQDLSNAYLESKFLAEKSILLQVPNGLRAKIMRVGNLQGRLSDGEFQMNQASNGFAKLLQSMVKTGRCPYTLAHSRVNFSPVDAVARAICCMAGSQAPYTVFHIFDDHDLPVSHLLEQLAAIGYPIEVLSDQAFDAFLSEAAEHPELRGALDGFLTRVTGGRHLVETPCESSFSLHALAQEGFHWPVITPAYLNAYLTGLDTLGTFLR